MPSSKNHNPTASPTIPNNATHTARSIPDEHPRHNRYRALRRNQPVPGAFGRFKPGSSEAQQITHEMLIRKR